MLRLFDQNPNLIPLRNDDNCMKRQKDGSMDGIDLVLHLRSSGGLLGAENVILEIAKHSKEYGYNSIIGVLKDARDPEPEILTVARKNGLQAVEFDCRRRIDFQCAKLIKKFVIDNDVSLLHCHGYKEDFYGLLCNSHIPLFATNHLWKTNSLMLRLYRGLDAFLLRRFNLVAGVSDEIVSEMYKLGIKEPIKVQNGVDIDKFNIDPKAEGLVREFGLNSNGIVFGMVSSLTSEKDHAIAINSFAKLEGAHAQLLIVGAGPLLQDLQTQVKRLGLDKKVFFIGRQKNIREILSIVDVFLLPSLKEGLPMALLEAMACGKAVIVSRVGENENVVLDKINGILFKPGDLEALVDAMEFLVERGDMVKQFGRQARLTVEAHFSSKKMTRHYCDLYDKIIKGSSA